MRNSILITALMLLPLVSLAQTIGAHGESIDEHGVIIDAPADAEIRQYERNGSFVYNFDAGGFAFAYEQSGSIDVAICADGTMFFQDFISETYYGTWVIGTRTGDYITIETGQKIFWIEYRQATISLQCYDIDHEVRLSPTDITFQSITYDNGREELKLQDCDNRTHVVGTVWDDDQSVDILGDYATELVYDPSNIDSVLNIPVVLPDDIEMKPYEVYCRSYRDLSYIRYTVQAGFDGDDMYIEGLYSFDAEMYQKGHLEDGVVTFPQCQYIGNDGRGTPIYAVAAYYGVDEKGIMGFSNKDQWTLTYNATNRKYEGGESCIRFFARHPYYRYDNLYESIGEIVLTPLFDEGIAGTQPDSHGIRVFDTMGRQLDPTQSHGLTIEVTPTGRRNIVLRKE